MNESDVKRIEDRFDFSLPSDYRHLLLHFPVRFSSGTTDQPLWDNADALIARNQELRTERKSLGVTYQPLPENFFLIGEDGAGWQFLIDICDERCVVHIMEFERVDEIGPSLGDGGQPERIADWLHKYLLDLKNDGIDITSSTAPEYKMGWGCIIEGLGLCLLLALVISLMVAGIESLTGR
ncbi:SMI1/KNR4 family protein [Rhodopirellula sp. MGV]|uniref:SMI1/KNR4 family protein n=1 Tax=Rhodopirellula sp. MGV TaxID=2023130 RepID=UPI000B97B92C|nr:SMI1/KNR4 family protein [Rhodopirellula sp. MGV]OYP34332.1 hypothetical protein CGZ80_14810 [Rhodopirellula sp. MGV]PNY35267.1 SMI1/KNR4 family protein [Rhodopirellula baltica]